MEKSKKPHRYKKRIISGFTTLILLLAVVACLYIMMQSLSNGYVRCGRTSLFRVVTGSMEPTISTGAILTAKESAIDTIEEGDIICFRSTNPGSEGVIVTHRVVRVYTSPDGTRCLQTKGDNKETNPTVDQTPVTEKNLIGRVTWHTGDESMMAKVISFLTSEFGFIACIVLPVLLIAVWVFRDAAKNLKKEIRLVEEDLDNLEQRQKAPAMSEEEYQKLYEQLKEEMRKEMEQHESPCDASAEENDSTSAAAPSNLDTEQLAE